MNPHPAKLAALMAYDVGALSEPARARIERHLANCASCNDALRAIRAYETLRREAESQPWPEPAWDRMELALRREAKQVARATRRERASGRNAALGGVAAMAAVLCLVVGGQWWSASTDSSRSARSSREDLALSGGALREALVEGALRLGTVTAVAGRATADAQILTLGASIAEGALLVASPSSAVHVRLADGTGFALDADTSAHLSRSRERTTIVTLESGRVTSRVAHLADGARYEIVAAPYVVHVRGTHFSVSRAETSDGASEPTAQVTVTVAEGVVDVTEGDTLVARIEGPSRWSGPVQGGGAHPSALVAPVGLALGAAEWPAIEIPRLEGVQSVEIDGVALSLAGNIAMRVSPGPHSGVAFGLSGVPVRFSFEVGPEGTSLDPTLMLAPTAAGGVERPRGTLDPAAVRGVVTRGMDGVQRCYRTALMRRPDLAGHMSLRITVEPSGRVGRALLSADTPYPWLATCVENQASAWMFPAPSGGASVSLSVPLDFSTRWISAAPAA